MSRLSAILSIAPGGRQLGAPLLLSLLALVVFVVPGADAALVYDRAAIGDGELWRLITGHWTHASLDHLLWDVAAFALLGVAVAGKSPKRFWKALLFSAPVIALALYALEPRWQFYRGLSGIDSALFVTLAVSLWLESPGRGARWLAIGSLAAYGGKVAFEALTGAPFFASDLPGHEVVPLAHLVGGLVGLVVAVSSRLGYDPTPRSFGVETVDDGAGRSQTETSARLYRPLPARSRCLF